MPGIWWRLCNSVWASFWHAEIFLYRSKRKVGVKLWSSSSSLLLLIPPKRPVHRRNSLSSEDLKCSILRLRQLSWHHTFTRRTKDVCFEAMAVISGCLYWFHCCNTFSFVSKIELYNTAQLINLIAQEAKQILTSQAWDVQAFLRFLWQTFYHSCAWQMVDPPAWQNKINRSFFVSQCDFSPHCGISLQLAFAVSCLTVLHDSELTMSN